MVSTKLYKLYVFQNWSALNICIIKPPQRSFRILEKTGRDIPEEMNLIVYARRVLHKFNFSHETLIWSLSTNQKFHIITLHLLNEIFHRSPYAFVSKVYQRSSMEKVNTG